MNKKKKTLKGFTLIELIIVLAIFSVIMVLVMSFIDPVSKLMSKTSVRERTASYADNIGEYVDKSVRHAQFIRIFEKGICKYPETNESLTEKEAVEAFVSDYFDEAVNDKLQPLEGKIRVLKLINTDEGGLESGRIYESVYNFKSGCGIWSLELEDSTPVRRKKWGDVDILYNVGDIRNGNVKVTETDGIGVPKTDSGGNEIKDEEGNTIILRKITETFTKGTADLDPNYTNVPVINPEHFENYSYYYKYDFQEFKPIADSDLSNYSPEPESGSKYYYSQLVPRTKNGADMILNSISDIGMVLNIVAYQNDAKGNNKINVSYEADDGSTVNAPIFKSPAYMDTVSMTFQNAIKQDKTMSFYRIDREEDTDNTSAFSNDTGKIKMTDDKISLDSNGIEYANKQFIHIVASGDASMIDDSTPNDNIYIIYAVPSEIEDTEWNQEIEP